MVKTGLSCGVPFRPLRLVAPILVVLILERALPVDYQFVNDPSGRRKILIGWLRVVNSAAIVNFDASRVTPNPGRSFGHSLPSLESKGSGRYGMSSWYVPASSISTGPENAAQT